MRISVSPKLEQDLTCLQVFVRAKDLLISGTVLYKLKCVLLNIHQKLPGSCIITSWTFCKGVLRNKYLLNQGHPKPQAEEMDVQEDYICGQSEDLTTSYESFCLQVRIQCVQANAKIPTTSHLITNLAYKLKPHHKRIST